MDKDQLGNSMGHNGDSAIAAWEPVASHHTGNMFGLNLSFFWPIADSNVTNVNVDIILDS